MKTNQKIDWINTLKSIGIISVVLGHIASPIGAFIFSWHMPLFFIMAGFFIKVDIPIKKFILKDFHRLMIPYFLFSFIGLGIDIIKRVVLHREELNYFNEIKGILYDMDMNGLIHHYGFVLWFLPTLFFARIMIVFLQQKIKNLFYNFIIIFILFNISFYIELPFALDNAFNAIIWVFIGFVFYNFFKDNKFLFIVPLLGFTIFILFGMPNLDIAIKSYSNIFQNILWSISITYILIIISQKIIYPKNISYLFNLWGENTMLIFITHVYTNNIANILSKIIGYQYWYIELFISLVLIQAILIIKLKFNNKGIFKYV